MTVMQEDLALVTKPTGSVVVRPYSPEPPDLPPPTQSSSGSKVVSIDTVASVASEAGSISPSITSLLCHKTSAPPSSAPPSRTASTTVKSEGYDLIHGKKTMGYFKTTLPVLVSEIDLESDYDDILEDAVNRVDGHDNGDDDRESD